MDQTRLRAEGADRQEELVAVAQERQRAAELTRSQRRPTAFVQPCGEAGEAIPEAGMDRVIRLARLQGASATQFSLMASSSAPPSGGVCA
jgi:hypothetical protein